MPINMLQVMNPLNTTIPRMSGHSLIHHARFILKLVLHPFFDKAFNLFWVSIQIIKSLVFTLIKSGIIRLLTGRIILIPSLLFTMLHYAIRNDIDFKFVFTILYFLV